MSIIEEIRQARKEQLTAEQKEGLLAYIKSELTTADYCVIDGAQHYHPWQWGRAHWNNALINEAPFNMHPAISEWLRGLGFSTSRYYNRGGVDNGLKVWIS